MALQFCPLWNKGDFARKCCLCLFMETILSAKQGARYEMLLWGGVLVVLISVILKTPKQCQHPLMVLFSYEQNTYTHKGLGQFILCEELIIRMCLKKRSQRSRFHWIWHWHPVILRHPIQTFVCLVCEFCTDSTMGFITIKLTATWENMFGSLLPTTQQANRSNRGGGYWLTLVGEDSSL